MRDQIRSHYLLSTAFVITALVVVIDRITKNFFSSILSIGESIPVIKNVFHITLVHNTGIAFGLFKDQGSLFIFVPIIAVILIGVYIFRAQSEEECGGVYFCAFALILGGAIGNLIDRIVVGHVIDFLDFRVWPVFNIADTAISIGIGLVLAMNIFSCRKR